MDLPKSHQEAAERELNETPSVRDQAVRDLRARIPAGSWSSWMTWLHPDPDVVLVWYLRWAKMDVDKAYKRLAAMDKHLQDPVYGPLDNINADNCRTLHDQGVTRLLPAGVSARSGASVALILPSRMACLEDPSEVLRSNIWMLRRCMRDPNPDMQVHGQLILEDFSEFGLVQMFRMRSKLPSSIMNRSMHFMQECAPFRLKGLVLVNQPSFISFLFAMVKPFMSAKLKSRIRMVGGSRAALAEIVDLSLLPASFGNGMGTKPEEGGAQEEDWFERQARLEREGR